VPTARAPPGTGRGRLWRPTPALPVPPGGLRPGSPPSADSGRTSVGAGGTRAETSNVPTAGPVSPATAGPGSTRITFLGHASFLFEAGGETLLTDPVFSDRIAHLFTKRSRPSRFRPEEIPGELTVLISHGHHDHLDYRSLGRVGRRRQLVVPWGLAPMARLRGFTNVLTLRPWESADFGRWRVTAVPSRHFGGRLPFLYTSGYQGYVLSGPSCIYFAGDTGFDAEIFRAIRARFVIDLAVLPIDGAFFPPYRRNHMNVEDALAAFRELGAGRMLPMHFDTYPASMWSEGHAGHRLLVEAARSGLAGRVTLLDESASLDLPTSGTTDGPGTIGRSAADSVAPAPRIR
jgi:L-ascorbate metabolism protein UlaG (beta-lactamase superfamily)